jgi:hypothetical protein
MSIETIAAIYGAIAGISLSGLFEFIKWQITTKNLKKAIQIGLYYEIHSHSILELEPDNDGQPNCTVENFQNDFYKSNLSVITKLLNERIVQNLAFYFSNLQLASNIQKELFKLVSEANGLTAKMPLQPEETRKLGFLQARCDDARNVLRVCLVPAIKSKEDLLLELKKVFKNPPEKRTFIDVPSKYSEWWEKITKDVR